MTDTLAKPWYERQPDRLEWELNEFRRQGLEPRQGFDDDGDLVVKVDLDFKGEPLEVTATFSPEHPYFAPEITADRVVIDRHQDPVGKNFCLLENPGNDWEEWFSAGELVGETLRQLLADSEEGTDAVYAGEADMPEPASAQLRYDSEFTVLVGDPFLESELPAEQGTIKLLHSGDELRVLVEATGLGELDSTGRNLFSVGDGMTSGRWLALDHPLRPEAGRDGVLQELEEHASSILDRLHARVNGRKKKLRHAETIVGITYMEQGPTRDEERRTWVFAELEQRRDYKARVKSLARAQALTKTERAHRLPDLTGLDGAHVVLIGAGSVGAPIAAELAKAGVGTLEIFDHDRFDVNNAVRHVLPVLAAGQPKAEAVARHCTMLNPFIVAIPRNQMLGGSIMTTALLEAALERATVVVDATGSRAVGRFLESKTRAASVDLVVVGLTASSFGADVLVIEPDGACLFCFADAQNRGQIPTPEAGDRSALTPIGCRHPAFSGAGFEATELAAIATRIVVQRTKLTAYPESGANWVVVNFRSEPHLEQGYLTAQSDCGAHP